MNEPLPDAVQTLIRWASAHEFRRDLFDRLLRRSNGEFSAEAREASAQIKTEREALAAKRPHIPWAAPDSQHVQGFWVARRALRNHPELAEDIRFIDETAPPRGRF